VGFFSATALDCDNGCDIFRVSFDCLIDF